MSEETKILSFVAFCIERYKSAHHLEGVLAARHFQKLGSGGEEMMAFLTQKVTQENVHMLLPWKAAGFAELWAKDLHIKPLDALMRFYATPLYHQLEDESTKLWTYSPEQLYYIFRQAA